MNAQQLALFDVGQTLTEISVEALKGDDESIRAAATSLLVLVKYHEALNRSPRPVKSHLIATRMLSEARHARSQIMAADILARAAQAVLDGQPGAFTDLAECLHDYDRTRRALTQNGK